MPDLERSVYVIKGCLHSNYAALRNDIANEGIVGVSPKDENSIRESEKVGASSTLNFF